MKLGKWYDDDRLEKAICSSFRIILRADADIYLPAEGRDIILTELAYYRRQPSRRLKGEIKCQRRINMTGNNNRSRASGIPCAYELWKKGLIYGYLS